MYCHSCEEAYKQNYFKVINTSVTRFQNQILSQLDVKKTDYAIKHFFQKEAYKALALYPEIDTSTFKVKIQLSL